MNNVELIQQSIDPSLSWLFYILLAFMALVIFVGALTGRERSGRGGGKPTSRGGTSGKSKTSSRMKNSTGGKK